MDEVEMHFHNKEGDFIHSPGKELSSNSDNEQISNDEEENVASKFSAISGSINFQKNHIYNSVCDRASTWSAVFKEAEELECLHENAGNSLSSAANSKGQKNLKGNKGKSKRKFSFRFQSYEEEPLWTFMEKREDHMSSELPQMPEGLEALEHNITEHSMTELLEGLHEKGKKSEDLNVSNEFVQHGHKKHSMAELLEGVLGKNDPEIGASKPTSKAMGRKSSVTSKRNISLLGDRALDNEDPPEPMDSETSTEDETNDQNQLKHAITETKGQTMTDRFQEALIAATGNDRGTLFPSSKQTGIGYHGKLQQVMQIEKERQAEFLKQLQAGASPDDEMRCVDVEILSRYLDAKLTVCHCSLGKNAMTSQCAELPLEIMDLRRMKRTIIFNSRICDSVELEVGNLIRIFPPWKEVQIMGDDESIILCTYFSQISA